MPRDTAHHDFLKGPPYNAIPAQYPDHSFPANSTTSSNIAASHATNHHHPPVEDRQRSSYSELAANIAYFSELNKMAMHRGQARVPFDQGAPCSAHQLYRASSPELDHPPPPHTPVTPSKGNTARRSKSRSKTPKPEGNLRKPTKAPSNLACFFCRERKIACGKPEEGSTSLTCKYVGSHDCQCYLG